MTRVKRPLSLLCAIPVVVVVGVVHGQGPQRTGGALERRGAGDGTPHAQSGPKMLIPDAKPVRSCESLAMIALSNTTIVEEGKAPETLLATRRDQAGTLMRSRPLCPYPLVAKYKGSGSTDDSTSFVCSTAF